MQRDESMSGGGDEERDAEYREIFSELRDDERLVLCRNNEEVAALVSLADLALLDEIEERLDIEAYDRAKKEFEESGRQSVPFEDVCREMGL